MDEGGGVDGREGMWSDPPRDSLVVQSTERDCRPCSCWSSTMDGVVTKEESGCGVDVGAVEGRTGRPMSGGSRSGGGREGTFPFPFDRVVVPTSAVSVGGVGSSTSMDIISSGVEVVSEYAMSVKISFTSPVVPVFPPVVDAGGAAPSTRGLYQNTLTCVALLYGPSRNLGLSYAISATSLDGNSINAFPPPFKYTALARNRSPQDLTNSMVLQLTGRSSMTSEWWGSGWVTSSSEDQRR